MTSLTTVRSLRPTRIEIDTGAIAHNVARLGALTHRPVCAVVKADGYGHGAVAAARAALEGGAGWLAVAIGEEGLALREAGIDAPILVLTETPIDAVPMLLAADLTLSGYRAPFLAALAAAGRHRGRPVPVHVKIDTGMGRVGLVPDTWTADLASLMQLDGLVVDGLFTHLARADEVDDPTTDQQLAQFDLAVAAATAAGLRPTWRHAANTAAALLHPDAAYDLVRPGIGIYGLSPAADVDAAAHGLMPALRLVSKVGFVKRVRRGTPVSYGHRWSAPTDGWLATIPIGYADGLPRALSNHADVLIRGRRRNLVGTVTMDQILVWCDQEEPQVGDEVVLLGAQGEEHIRVEDWAAAADTITYEIVTQLTARLPRIHR